MAHDLHITQESNALRITYGWRTGSAYFLAVFAFIWNAFIIVALLAGAGFIIIFHALVGAYLAYYCLTRFLNRTTMMVTERNLKIEHGPLYWPFTPERDIPARSLVQVYVEKSSVTVNNASTFNLIAKLDTGATVKLLGMEPERARMEKLERAIETYLHIEDDASASFREEGFEGMELSELKEKIRQFEPIKNWLPAGMRRKIEETQAEVVRQVQRSGDRRPGEPKSDHPTAPLDGTDFSLDTGPGEPGHGAKPLPSAPHNYNFPVYSARPGEVFNWSGKAHRVTRTAQIDFEDPHTPTGRQVEVVGVDSGEPRYLYSQLERSRWAYWEERRLDELELNKLGFGMSVNDYPLRLENGGDRYYPRDEQKGTRYAGAGAEPVRQFIYFTTVSATQFRGLETRGRGWEVYVMELVDAGVFAAP